MDARVLLVSDDSETGRVWAYAMGQKGLEITLTKTAEEALDQWAREIFDLILIDIYASQLDDIDLCRKLRFEIVNPLLLLIPKSDEAHLLKAYRVGVDECIIKPISPPLLLAKVMAWLRRSWTVSAEALAYLQLGDLRLDPAQRQVVTSTGRVVKLTNLEFRLLHLLMTGLTRWASNEAGRPGVVEGEPHHPGGLPTATVL